MKRFTRCACAVLAVFMLLVTPAFAAETQNSRASMYFTMYSAYLSTVSGNTFDVCFSVTATGIMEELGSSVIVVQRRASENDQWQDVKTYYPSVYKQMIDYDQVTHSATVRYTGTSGYEYRAYVELYAKNSSGTGYTGAYAYF